MESEYTTLIEQTIRGIQIRGFFFGYASKRLSNYLYSQNNAIDDLRDRAYDLGIKLDTKKNLNLSTDKLKLETRILKAKVNEFERSVY